MRYRTNIINLSDIIYELNLTHRKIERMKIINFYYSTGREIQKLSNNSHLYVLPILQSFEERHL